MVHGGGATYVSVIGSNALFHNLADAAVQTVHVPTIARFVDAFTAVARTLIAA